MRRTAKIVIDGPENSGKSDLIYKILTYKDKSTLFNVPNPLNTTALARINGRNVEVKRVFPRNRYNPTPESDYTLQDVVLVVVDVRDALRHKGDYKLPMEYLKRVSLKKECSILVVFTHCDLLEKESLDIHSLMEASASIFLQYRENNPSVLSCGFFNYDPSSRSNLDNLIFLINEMLPYVDVDIEQKKSSAKKLLTHFDTQRKIFSSTKTIYFQGEEFIILSNVYQKLMGENLLIGDTVNLSYFREWDHSKFDKKMDDIMKDMSSSRSSRLFSLFHTSNESDKERFSESVDFSDFYKPQC